MDGWVGRRCSREGGKEPILKQTFPFESLFFEFKGSNTALHLGKEQV